MFRRLRERLAEELEAQATRFPGGQHAFNSSPGGKSTDSAPKSQEETSEDLITLSDSPSVVVPHTSPQQFSIGDDDGFPSETSTPQKKQGNSSDMDQYYSPSSSADQQSAPSAEVQNILPTYTPSKRSFYVPQSDIESEVEEPPTLKLDGISIDQLSATNEVLKAKLYKYKDKYTKIVQAYKEMNEEKKKIEHTLTECQDKALRRIAELKEQCHLEQKAKAHLEENLRIYLEEKEEMINVLQTKIELLKEGRNIDAPETPVQEKELPDEDSKSEETSSGHIEEENVALRDKVKKLQALLEKCKETIVNNKEQMNQVLKERDNVSQLLEAKTKEIEELKSRESHSQSELEVQLQSLQSRLTELEQQQAESAMSMAETKKNMHEELEIKEQQLTKAKEDIKQLQRAVDHERNLASETKKQHEETIEKLQNKLKITEKLMEEEKQNLMQELSRGKAAAVALMQQECAKKLSAVEAEWKDRLKESEIQSEKALHEKEREVNEVISQKEVEFQNLQRNCEKQRLTAEELERQNEKLSEAVESIRAKNLEGEKQGYLMSAELGYKEEFNKLTEKINVLEAEKKKFEKKKTQEIEDVKQEMSVKLEELRNKLTLQLQAKNDEHEAVLSQKTKLQTDCSILQESVKDKESIILQIKSTMSSAEKENQCKMEEMNTRIKQLELEREHLMLQAQERVAATEAKCRENINSLTEKINELQSKEREIEILKSDIGKLNSQLDESLIVAEANQSAAAQELSILKAHLSTTQKELEDAVGAHSFREAELLNQVKSFENDMLCLEKEKKNFEAVEAEKVVLLERIQNFEEKMNNDSLTLNEIHSLKEENERLQSEIGSLVALRKDNEALTAKVHSLESNEKDLHEKLYQLEATNIELRTSVTNNSVKQSSDKDSCDPRQELAHLQNENRALLDKVRILEESISKNSDASFTEYIDLIKRDYEGKLSAKDAEMESKLKKIIKDFASQMNVKEKDYDEILSQVLENSQNQEGKLLREHRLEIASLRQEIFEKDCALEEMHDHYEEIMKEKDAKLKELEKKCSGVSSSAKHGSDPTATSNETSDWDDNWVECEENCDSASPIHSNKGDCATHVQQIHMLQEELEKCNSEIKDLRVLLRLSPPQSLASNNDSKSSSLLLPEPTEFEYLKNILFEYMMGKEPLTLAKVIAAVLRFSDEQTQLVLKKEELKQTMRTQWLGLNS